MRKYELLRVTSICLVVFLLLSLMQYFNHVKENPKYSALQMEQIIRKEKTSVQHQLENYSLPLNMDLTNSTLSDGKKPIRNVIIATWRSGSTFLAEIANSVPGTFYHYEPLLHFGYDVIGGPPYADDALRTVKKLLMCDYSGLDDYINFARKHNFLFYHNDRLWKVCIEHPEYCFNSTFLEEYCKIFPFQLVKTVRWRLKMAEEVLKDKRYLNTLSWLVCHWLQLFLDLM